MRFQFPKNSRLWLFTNCSYRPAPSVIVRDYARWWELSDQSASWLVLTTITGHQSPDTQVMWSLLTNKRPVRSVTVVIMFNVRPPGLIRADCLPCSGRDSWLLVVAITRLSPLLLSTLHWEHYPCRILRLLSVNVDSLASEFYPHFFSSIDQQQGNQHLYLQMNNHNLNVLSNIDRPAPVLLLIPIAHHNILMRYVLLLVFHFIITLAPTFGNRSIFRQKIKFV